MAESDKPLYSPHLLEQIIDSLPGQMAYWDRDLICRFANRAYFNYFSLPREAIIGIHMKDLLGAPLFSKNTSQIDCVLRGQPQSFVRSIKKVDGTIAQVDVKYVPDRNANGHTAGFYVSVNDVTTFKRIEEQLREKEAELTALVARREDAISWLEMAEEVAHVGHWRMNVTSGAITWSDEMYRIHGVTRECYHPDIQTVLAFHCPEDRPRVQALMQRAITQGLPYEDMGRVLRRDGEFRYVKTRGMATRDPDGSPVVIFGVFVDVTEQQKVDHELRVAYEKLEAIAHLDGLTGISNRRRFDDAFDREWRAASQSGHPLSIVLIDVDRFKAYNDTYGHQAGDACLQAVAVAIKSATRRSHDLVARYGGEEFVVLLPATDRAAATLIAERARLAVEALGRKHEGNGPGIVTISAGVGSMQSIGPDWDNQAQVVSEADAMLYRAKHSGRNLVCSSAVPIEAVA